MGTFANPPKVLFSNRKIQAEKENSFCAIVCAQPIQFMKHLLLSLFLLSFGASVAFAQGGSRITGNLQSNGNFFIKDEKIGASGTPQYDYQKFGAESWLNLNYSNWGFDLGLRFDLFNNSNLLNPTGSFTDEGIGRWFIAKKIGKLDLAGGYLYDQIGSGIIFQAYEQRALMIDNALYGIRAAYNFNDNWRIKAFTGRQKRQFDQYGSVIRGLNFEGFTKPDSTKNLTLAPGVGIVARTYDDETINRVVNAIATYTPADSIGAQYNTYAFTVYNTLTAGKFSWFIEGAYKTKDVLFNEFEERATGGLGKLVNTDGYTVYSSMTYANKGLGISLEGKRTENFRFRTDPFQIGVQGQINFLPPMARQNTYRLTARFSPNTQELGEQALQLDVRYAFNRKFSVGVNVSDIQLLDGTELYREISPEFTYKYKRKWQLLGGLQLLRYNIEVYQGKAGYVDAITPYTELLYKFTPRRSLRVEASYLSTEEEFGSWAFGLVELGLAPHWLIFASDMYKMKHEDPESFPAEKTQFDGLHYPTVGVVYTNKANRYAISYVKQVEGINCAGGICRYEPTFHGVRIQINSAF
jgi:hypothetical protein